MPWRTRRSGAPWRPCCAPAPGGCWRCRPGWCVRRGGSTCVLAGAQQRARGSSGPAGSLGPGWEGPGSRRWAQQPPVRRPPAITYKGPLVRRAPCCAAMRCPRVQEELSGQGVELLGLEAYLPELGLTPDALELPVPACFREDRAQVCTAPLPSWRCLKKQGKRPGEGRGCSSWACSTEATEPCLRERRAGAGGAGRSHRGAARGGAAARARR